MAKPAIASVEDIEAFFSAYNRHDWDGVFDYMSDDCVWNASERRLKGRRAIIEYWTNYHAAFKETLGKPRKVVFGDRMIYLQVEIHLDFLEDAVFCGRSYKKGETLDFLCADFYELDDQGKIAFGCAYASFVNA